MVYRVRSRTGSKATQRNPASKKMREREREEERERKRERGRERDRTPHSSVYRRDGPVIGNRISQEGTPSSPKWRWVGA